MKHIIPSIPLAPALLDRRQWLRRAVAAGLGAALPLGCARRGPEPISTALDGPLRFPGKVPMRALNDSPPNLETPWQYYRYDLTPNEAFFVRWHIQFIPTMVDLSKWRLTVGGHVERRLELSMDQLRRMKSVSIVAVNQCSGNSRNLFEPRVTGGQWGNGAMGNARWTGVPLRHLLAEAGVKEKAVEVSFAGLDRSGFDTVPDNVKALPINQGPGDSDRPPPPLVPDFVKSLPVERATDPAADILVAYEMNGEPLPLLNGFPVRLVVPGWYATYWVKALTNITVLSKPFVGFWMNPAYRIPTTPNAVESPNDLAKKTVPINFMNVRSFFVTPERGSRVPRGQACQLEGIAFDGGSGIERIEISVDGGGSWHPAKLGDDLGNYSFRRWRFVWRPQRDGLHRLLVRAFNRNGDTQSREPGWNRSGYMRNVIEEWPIEVGGDAR